VSRGLGQRVQEWHCFDRYAGREQSEIGKIPISRADLYLIPTPPNLTHGGHLVGDMVLNRIERDLHTRHADQSDWGKWRAELRPARQDGLVYYVYTELG
jgi:hypothetical protein